MRQPHLLPSRFKGLILRTRLSVSPRSDVNGYNYNGYNSNYNYNISSPRAQSTTVPPSGCIPNPLPAWFIRGGTSKGVFINQKYVDLPSTSFSSSSSSPTPTPTSPSSSTSSPPPPPSSSSASLPPPLPPTLPSLTPIFTSLMGSPDPVHARQLNGMGGGISSLSKIMIVGRVSEESRRVIGEMGRENIEDVHIEYTFVQVGIKNAVIDCSGNCGNLSAMVGVFAVDEGLVGVRELGLDGWDLELDMRGLGSTQGSTSTSSTPIIKTVKIKAFNTNTKKIISTTFPVSITPRLNAPVPLDKAPPQKITTTITPLLDLPQTTMAGVPGLASSILLNFENPAGARTGRLLPTGNVVDVIRFAIEDPRSSCSGTVLVDIKATLIDATNPTVFVLRADLEKLGVPVGLYIGGRDAEGVVGGVLERIRREGARMMGLDVEAEAQPKIAILGEPVGDGLDVSVDVHARKQGCEEQEREDIVIHALSMGVLHKAVPMTVGLCLGVAAGVEGSLAWEVVRRVRERRGVGGGGGAAADIAVNGANTDNNPDGGIVKIRHPGGIVDVKAMFGGYLTNGEVEVKSVGVVRTGRRLMRGEVFW